MRIDFERQERIDAPVEQVWDELDSLEDILTKTPQIARHAVRADGSTADLQVVIRWGPVRRTVDAIARQADVRPFEGLALRVDAPSIDVHADGSLTIRAGGEAETALTYSMQLESGHWFSRRMRSTLTDMLEGHVHSLIDSVKARAEAHHQAEKRLMNNLPNEGIKDADAG